MSFQAVCPRYCPMPGRAAFLSIEQDCFVLPSFRPQYSMLRNQTRPATADHRNSRTVQTLDQHCSQPGNKLQAPPTATIVLERESQLPRMRGRLRRTGVPIAARDRGHSVPLHSPALVRRRFQMHLWRPRGRHSQAAPPPAPVVHLPRPVTIRPTWSMAAQRDPPCLTQEERGQARNALQQTVDPA